MIDKYSLTNTLHGIARRHLQTAINNDEIDGGQIRSITETGRLEFTINIFGNEGLKSFVVKVMEPR